MSADLARLTPLDIRWEEDRPIVRWCDFGDLAFVDPFLRQTYARVLAADPGRATPESGIESLKAAVDSALEPAGLIFHMSRCGSTVVSRLLASSPRTLMVAEPASVYRLLEAPPEIGEEQRCAWLRDLILALGRPRRSTEERYVLKLSSVLTGQLPLFRRAFPRTPWIFVFRRPVEVMASVIGSSSGWFPGLRAEPWRALPLLRLEPREIAEASDAELAARILARICGAALVSGEAAPELARFVEYRQLPRAVWACVAPFFGVPTTAGERAAMQSLSRFYSKDPETATPFRRDARKKTLRAGRAVRAGAEQWVDPLYRELLRHSRETA